MEFRVLGLMSGTSLDGLDLALCVFKKENQSWSYSIEHAKTYPYTHKWRKKLENASLLSGLDLVVLNNDYGNFLAESCLKYLKESNGKFQFIASHGHTVFHQPEKGITFQLGAGSNISAKTGITTISDFRSQDVAMGGQGAPLVPVGDALLFSAYDFCLNLGGFGNISYDTLSGRVAFDVCPVNIVLNYLTEFMHLPYDRGGEIGRKGKNFTPLLNELNNLNYYTLKGPKSLGKEWVDENIHPLLNKYAISLEDKLRTYYQHICNQIKNTVVVKPGGKLFITGGGAHNSFLIHLLQKELPTTCILPSDLVIDFKEALIFGFLGLLCYCKEINSLKSVTGAYCDHVSGAIYQGWRKE